MSLRLRLPLLCLALSSGCGEDPDPIRELDLDARYLGIGVVRVDGELGQNAYLRSFEFVLEDLLLIGGTVSGSARNLEGTAPFRLDGSYDRDNNQMRFSGGSGAVTSTATEQVVRFGFRPDDGVPVDGVASELIGFVDTATQGATSSGRWVAVVDGPDKLDAPDPTRISITASERLGVYIIEGLSRASPGGAGLQVMRFSPELDVPRVETVPVEFSGAFIIDAIALPGDIIVLRPIISGRSGPGVALPVP